MHRLAFTLAVLAAAAALGVFALGREDSGERPGAVVPELAAAIEPGTAASASLEFDVAEHGDSGGERSAARPVEPVVVSGGRDAVKVRQAAGTVVRDADPAVVEAIQPLRVRIPRIGVDANIIDLGLNDDGSLEVPTDYAETGWYTGRPAPGEVGPSVVVGHVDSTRGPAVFFRLRDLEVGDLIAIDRSDGLVAWFKTRKVTLVDKDGFPTKKVYGANDEPVLRLITCGGDFDRSAGSYVGNLIVYADHLGNLPPDEDVQFS
jgi:sortase (surface protein transpeptidase)